MKTNTKKTDTPKPFIEHLRELRFRLITSAAAIVIGAIAAYIFYDYIIELLSRPFTSITPLVSGKRLFINSIYEGFFIRLKISFLLGVILSLPVHLFNVIRFVFPALTIKEKEVFIFSLLSSFALILGGGYYTYFKLIPLSVGVLTSTSFIPANTALLLNFGQNIFYILQFFLAALLIFQLPLVLELLLIMEIIKRKTLMKAGRIFIVVIFILSALLTPPDIISQVGFAVPLIILFYLVILIAKIFKFGEA